MKKVILLIVVMIFAGVTAQAYEVSYDITGRPTHVSYGGGIYTRSINNFGTNAAFMQQNPAIAVGHVRSRRHMHSRRFARTHAQTLAERNRINGHHRRPVSNMVQTRLPEISRFDKSYQISTGRSYTRNGITYFD